VKNRVGFQESIPNSLDRVKFLRRFVFKDLGGWRFNLDEINDYMKDVEGWIPITSDTTQESQHMNKILEEAEKRGDL
jgi:division protein CdvB (Snf7/Vps24/ESCRT-III family)